MRQTFGPLDFSTPGSSLTEAITSGNSAAAHAEQVPMAAKPVSATMESLRADLAVNQFLLC